MLLFMDLDDAATLPLSCSANFLVFKFHTLAALSCIRRFSNLTIVMIKKMIRALPLLHSSNENIDAI